MEWYVRAIVSRSEAGGRGSASEEHDLADSCPTSAGREKVRKLPVSSYPPVGFVLCIDLEDSSPIPLLKVDSTFRFPSIY